MVGIQTCSEVGGHCLNEDAFCVQAHPLAAGTAAIISFAAPASVSSHVEWSFSSLVKLPILLTVSWVQ